MTDVIRQHPELQIQHELMQAYANLLKEGTPETSHVPFIQELKARKFTPEEAGLFAKVKIMIILAERNNGFGYLSSSAEYDRKTEQKTASLIANFFQERGEIKQEKTTPIFVTIDDFYKLMPDLKPSFVAKARIVDSIASLQKPNEACTLILTGFTDSKIFTEETLEQVPTQEQAGLYTKKETEFGKNLLKFAEKLLPKIISAKNGNLNEVLNFLTDNATFTEQDAKLLLATALLLQDIHQWQDLWYERMTNKAVFYIVAPQPFHDAMNRLNMNWGHGLTDYDNRASITFGAHNTSPLEKIDDEEQVAGNKLKKGLEMQEFERRIAPILNRFLETA
ncbi:MAG: hypothetical protein PHQ18_00435 [Patescibacteria group bacterium]|nr:hypothetical protein [Patescibacteria group bacterium]